MRFETQGTKLVIFADEDEREEMKDRSSMVGYHNEAEALESLIANSKLDWISSEETGDLTDAPILGIRGGYYKDNMFIHTIEQRWAFMDYQVRSFVEDLIRTGKCVFVSE